MHDPLVLAVKIADSVGMESSVSRDTKCLQLARWLREDSATESNPERLLVFATALDSRFGDVGAPRWRAAMYLMSIGKRSAGAPRPKFLSGWTKAEIEHFVLSGAPRSRHKISRRRSH